MSEVQIVKPVVVELDVYTVPELRDDLRRLTDAETARIVVDLSEVTYLDSTALGVLIGGLKRAREYGGTLEIACTPDNTHVRRRFQITGLEQIFTIHDAVPAGGE